MISDYVIYLVCGIGLLLICIVFYTCMGRHLRISEKNILRSQRKNDMKKRIKSSLRKRRKQIESEAFRKYPGIGGKLFEKARLH